MLFYTYRKEDIKMKNKKKFMLDMSEELHLKCRSKALKEGKSLGSIIREFLENWLLKNSEDYSEEKE